MGTHSLATICHYELCQIPFIRVTKQQDLFMRDGPSVFAKLSAQGKMIKRKFKLANIKHLELEFILSCPKTRQNPDSSRNLFTVASIVGV